MHGLGELVRSLGKASITFRTLRKLAETPVLSWSLSLAWWQAVESRGPGLSWGPLLPSGHPALALEAPPIPTSGNITEISQGCSCGWAAGLSQPVAPESFLAGN